MVSYKNALDEAIKLLSQSRVDSPELDARLLLQAASEMSQTELFVNYSHEINKEIARKFQVMLERRLKHEPVGRILGSRAFWRHEFKISDETLEPRPDTELIIEKVIERCSGIKMARIADLGTGSGCILISLLHELRQATGIGIDISKNALATAMQNAYDANVHERIEFINSSWLDLGEIGQFDIVVSNPPYIRTDDIEALSPEVRIFDPKAALDGGKDGLDCYRDIIALMPKILKENGWVFFEIGYNQGHDVQEMLAKGGFAVVEIAADLAGRDRCIIARRSV